MNNAYIYIVYESSNSFETCLVVSMSHSYERSELLSIYSIYNGKLIWIQIDWQWTGTQQLISNDRRNALNGYSLQICVTAEWIVITVALLVIWIRCSKTVHPNMSQSHVIFGSHSCMQWKLLFFFFRAPTLSRSNAHHRICVLARPINTFSCDWICNQLIYT